MQKEAKRKTTIQVGLDSTDLEYLARIQEETLYPLSILIRDAIRHHYNIPGPRMKSEIKKGSQVTSSAPLKDKKLVNG